MGEPVKVVPLETEEFVEGGAGQAPEPFVIGDLGVGIVSTDLVEAEKEKDGRVGDQREGESLPCQYQKRHEDKHQYILQCPVLAVERSNGEEDPFREEERAE